MDADATDIAFAGISRQAEMIRSGEISSSELVALYLERIARINPRLNAFTLQLGEQAREAARVTDGRVAAGEQAPLLGVPVALKDELDHVEGLVTSNGTAAFDEPAVADAEHTRRLRAAGAIVLAKTTLPELAICGFTETEAWGETRNPWNTERTPGGSSGGSGAAVAAGLVGAASGSDGAGSIRIPAANCGLFGLKPQRGRVSLAPAGEHWLGMTVSGCLSRRVADTALWLDVATGSPVGDGFREAAAREPGKLRIALSLKPARGLAPAIVSDEVASGVRRTGEVLRSLGHTVGDRDPEWGSVGNDFANRYLAGIEQDYALVPHPERLESRTAGFNRLARLIPGRLKRASVDREAAHAARINRIFDDFDLLLTPTTGETAVEVGRWAGKGALRTVLSMSRTYPFTAVWNYTGQPAAAIPVGFTGDGLPLSAQLIAPPGREDLLLSVGAQLERELDLLDRHPGIAG